MPSNIEPLSSEEAYCAITEGIKVTISVDYLGEHPFPEAVCHIWVYNVHITNQSEQTVQILSAHLKIIDKHGGISEKIRVGVVGEQPFLKPHEVYEYIGAVYLKNSTSGIMQGYYKFIDHDKQKEFEVAIPPFSLDTPSSSVLPN